MDSEEVELEFKRFSKEKQEQIRQLVAYTTLMGLTGKDLISIGGKLDRMEQRKERVFRYSIVESYDVKPIGQDKNINERFKLKINDTWYHFKYHYGDFVIFNCKTQRKTHHFCSYNDWGRTDARTKFRFQILWELYNGMVTLP